MKITREVRFSQSEVKEITEAALIRDTREIIGEPKSDETWKVEYNTFSDSTVEIVPLKEES